MKTTGVESFVVRMPLALLAGQTRTAIGMLLVRGNTDAGVRGRGGDLSRLPCSYREGLACLSGEVPWPGAEDKERVPACGVCAWPGWALP